MAEHDHRWDAAQEGAELILEGELDAAASELEKQIELDPENEYAHFFLGSAEYERGNFPKALKAYLRALEIKPEYPAALGHMGHTLRMMGRYDEAIRVGREMLKRNAEDADALYLLGLCHYSLGDMTEAVPYLKKYLASDPELEVAVEVKGLLGAIEGDEPPIADEDSELN